MKKILIIILIIILGSLSVFQFFKIRDLEKSLSDKPNLIYSSSPIEVPDKLKEDVNPETITKYPLDTTNTEYKDIKSLTNSDSLVLFNHENRKDTLIIHKQYILQYPDLSKLIYFNLNQNNLQLSLIDINGNLTKSDYNLDFLKYQYRFSDNKLSAQKLKLIDRIKPEITYSFRPFVNFHDLNLNLKLDTKIFTYRVGLNSYYYQKLDNKFGITPILSITYKP